jgi:hypothetical protein
LRKSTLLPPRFGFHLVYTVCASDLCFYFKYIRLLLTSTPPSEISPIYRASFPTFADAPDSDATNARTPATYAKTHSKHRASYKCSQPARRRARVPQCNCDDCAICRGSPSHVAMTASEPHSRRLPRRVHTLAITFQATDSVYQSRGDMRGSGGARTAQA